MVPSEIEGKLLNMFRDYQLVLGGDFEINNLNMRTHLEGTTLRMKYEEVGTEILQQLGAVNSILSFYEKHSNEDISPKYSI